MLWVLFSVLAGFFVALSDALNKKFLAHEGPYAMLIARTLGSFPFLFPLFLYFILAQGFSYFSLKFFLVVTILLFLELLATIFYMKGIKVAPLSATLPFLSFTPVFVVLTGYILLGERVSYLGVLGIFLVVFGSYFIYLPERANFFDPFFKIFKEKGSRFLLYTAFIYGVTSVLGKKGLLLSDPVFFASFYFSVLGLAGGFLGKLVGKISLEEVWQRKGRAMVLVGGTQALMCLCHMLALSQVETAYMIALKRTSILFGVLFGYLYFKERYIFFRLSGALLMLLGILVITFGK